MAALSSHEACALEHVEKALVHCLATEPQNERLRNALSSLRQIVAQPATLSGEWRLTLAGLGNFAASALTTLSRQLRAPDSLRRLASLAERYHADLDTKGFHSALSPHVYHCITLRNLSDCVRADLYPILTSLSALFHVLEVFFRAPVTSADPKTALSSVPRDDASPAASAKVRDASADRYIALLASRRSFLTRIDKIPMPPSRRERLRRFVTSLTDPLVLHPQNIVWQPSEHPFFDTGLVAKNQAAYIKHASLKVNDGSRPLWTASVVLKVFELASSTRQHHFGQESLRMRTLAHPSIPLFHGHFADFKRTDNCRVVIATERLSCDLRSAKNFQALSPFEVRVRVLCDIAKALAFLHRNRVYHAALKPENVLLRLHPHGLQGTAKLDVTCILRRALQLSLSRPRVYEPPEVYSTGFEAYYTGDVWSFGVLASFLLTDVSTEEDDTEFFKLAVTKGSAFPARAWARRVRHTAIRNLIGKCLAERPAHRITAQQLVEEFADVLRFNNANPQHKLSDEKGLEILGEKPFTGPASGHSGGLHYEGRTEGGESCGRDDSHQKKKSSSPRRFRVSGSGSVSLSRVKKEPHRSRALCPPKLHVETEHHRVDQVSESMRQKWERERLSEMEIDTGLGLQQENKSIRASTAAKPPSRRLAAEVPHIDLTGSDVNSVFHDTENDSSPVKIRRKRRRLLGPGSSKDQTFPSISKTGAGSPSSRKSVPGMYYASKAPKDSPKATWTLLRSPSASRRNGLSSSLFTSTGEFDIKSSSASKSTHVTTDAKKEPQPVYEPIRRDRKRREIWLSSSRTGMLKGSSNVEPVEGDRSQSTSGLSVVKRHSVRKAHKKPFSSPLVDGPGHRVILTGSPSPINANTREQTLAGHGMQNSTRGPGLFATGTCKMESELGFAAPARLIAGGDLFVRTERPDTPGPVSNAKAKNGTPATSKSDPGLQSSLNSHQSAALTSMSPSKEVDFNFSAPKVGRRRRRSRSRSVDVKEPKDEKRSEMVDEKATASNTPWAGRMRRRTSKRYSEEPFQSHDSDSGDFVFGVDDSSAGVQAPSRNDKQEKKLFKHLVSIKNKTLVNVSGSEGDTRFKSITLGPSRNEPFLLDSDVNGIYALGVLKGSKNGLDPFQYFKQEATKGDTMAQVRLGILYENGFHCQRDYGEAFYFFELAASKENNEGRLRLARCYEEGRGVSKNESAAVALYLHAADANSAVAHYKAAKCFLEGRGARQDIKKAVLHLEKAVEGNLLEAAYCLAELYNEGKHVGRDYAKAFYLYGSAALSGFVPAEVKLAHCYAKGKGCRRNIAKAVELYKKAADANDPEALYSIGLLYEDGQGVKASVPKALSCYIASADQGYPPGVTALGQCYLWGYGVPQDSTNAKRLFQKSADASNALAMLEIGNCYKEGNGCEQDIKQAVHYYQKASEHGNSVAMTELGECYYYGKGVDVDYDLAFSLFQKSADHGAAEGYRWLGDCYADSVGTEKDHKKAAQMYRKAIELGSNSAQLGLGSMYEHGLGVEKNKHKAIQMYRKAADKGNFTAMNNLGILYERGELVKQDYAKAVSYYQKAMELGCLDAICNLGDCYAAGNGVEMNEQAAFKLYQEAAEGGLASAVCELGVCFYRGRGVAPDHRRAMELLESIRMEEPEALRQLGVFHYDGIAVPRDYKKAYELFKESSDKGNKNACLSLALCLLNGEGVEKDEKAAIEALREAANSGNLAAFMYLGNCYYDGVGVGKNLEMAMECFKKGYDADPMLS